MTKDIPTRPPWLADVARDLPAIMTIEEVAAALRMHERTVRRHIKDRTLRAVQSAGSGSRVIVPRASVLDWLAAHEVA